MTNFGAIPTNAPASIVFRTTHTWAVTGEIRVASGDTDYIPPFFIAESSTQTTKLIKVRYRVNLGTNVTFSVNKSGGGGPTGLVATTSNQTNDFADVDVIDEERLDLVVTAISGSPQNLTVTLFFEHTVTT